MNDPSRSRGAHYTARSWTVKKKFSVRAREPEKRRNRLKTSRFSQGQHHGPGADTFNTSQ